MDEQAREALELRETYVRVRNSETDEQCQTASPGLGSFPVFERETLTLMSDRNSDQGTGWAGQRGVG